jgi:hypothetical protein
VRLAELNPQLDQEAPSPDVAYLSFDCPHCRGPGYITVKIAKTPAPGADRVWTWNGQTDVEKLTLTPSLNFAGHWHGFITNGEVTNA